MPIKHPSFAGSLNRSIQENAAPTTPLWVKLKASPSPYSHHEALLLCELSDEDWIAWVPGFGELRLTTAQFVID